MHGVLLAALVSLYTERDGGNPERVGEPKKYAMATLLRASRTLAISRDNLDIMRARYRQAIGRGTAGPAVFSELFYVDVRLRLDGEALEVGRRYISLQPNDERFRLDYAYELSRVHRPEAHAYFEQLSGSSTREIAQQARAELRAARPGGNDGQDSGVSDGYAALKKGDRSAAIADFRRHLAAFPNDAAVLLDLAFAQDAAGDHASSLASIERYLALRPDNQRAELQRAYELDAVGQHPAALELFGKLSASTDSVVAKAATDALARAGAGADGSDDALLAASYAKLQDGDRAGASAGFRQHLDSHPDDAAVWLALAYAQADDKDHAASLESLNRYLALRPGDPKAELQRAYDLDALGQKGDARASYRQLTACNDPKVAATALMQLTTAAEEAPLVGSSQTWVAWDSRFGDTFYGVDTNLRSNSGHLQPYFALHLSNDTRSSAGPVPTIFNDDSVIAALGFRARLVPGAYLYTEAGAFFGLLNQGTFPSLRIGLAYHGQLGQVAGSNTSLDLDVSHYSYYSGDLISYSTARHIIPVSPRFAILLGSNLGFDSQARYYNNFLEGLAGVQVSAPHVTLRLAQVYGTYIRGLAAPASHYWSVPPNRGLRRTLLT